MDGKTGPNEDMPAIWLLNAQIPWTAQYGPLDCSCWGTGCGEFDIVETLASGDMRCKSTLHTNTPGGDSDYIVRPHDDSSPMKLAVLFISASSSIQITVLDSSVEFSPSLTATQVDAFSRSTDKESTFAVVS
jgi:hypothetical protein